MANEEHKNDPKKNGAEIPLPTTGELYRNYMRAVYNSALPINESAPVTASQAIEDRGDTNGYSIRQLIHTEIENGLVPTYPVNSNITAKATQPSLPPRDLPTLQSNTFDDLVLAGVLSEGMNPKDVIKKFGKNAAFLTDKPNGEGNITHIVIMDPGTREMRAYKLLAAEIDMHTAPNNHHADPNGFSAAAFVKLKIDDKQDISPGKAPRKEFYSSAADFLKKHDWNLDSRPKEAEVRMEYGGFQVNLENWSTPGRLDRGEMSKQLSRVYEFNMIAAVKMETEGVPKNAVISSMGHSLGTGSAQLGDFYWKYDSKLKQHGIAGYVTLVEPVAETEAIRQIAFLIAAEKNIAAKQNPKRFKPSTVQEEVSDLLKNTDVIMLQDRSTLLKNFQVYGAKENNGIAGRVFQIPNPEAIGLDADAGHHNAAVADTEIARAELLKLRDHFVRGAVLQAIQAKGKLIPVENPATMTDAQIAKQPEYYNPKPLTDINIRDASYGIASSQQVTAMKAGFFPGVEQDFWETAKGIGTALNLPQKVVDTTIETSHVPSRIVPDTNLAKK